MPEGGRRATGACIYSSSGPWGVPRGILPSSFMNRGGILGEYRGCIPLPYPIPPDPEDIPRVPRRYPQDTPRIHTGYSRHTPRMHPGYTQNPVGYPQVPPGTPRIFPWGRGYVCMCVWGGLPTLPGLCLVGCRLACAPHHVAHPRKQGSVPPAQGLGDLRWA